MRADLSAHTCILEYVHTLDDSRVGQAELLCQVLSEMKTVMIMNLDVSWWPMVYHGGSWCAMVCHGGSWCVMVCHGRPCYAIDSEHK